MAKRLDVTEWARMGAEQRLQQLEEERAAIYRAFPDLRRGRPATRTVEDTEPTASRPSRRRRRRRNLSAEARQRISEVQKARWAKWRKAKGKD